MPGYDNTVLDAALDKIATATALHVVSGALPADRAATIAASLATIAVDSGDFTKADGNTDGRKVTVAAQSAVDVTASGTPTFYVLIDATVRLAWADVNAASPDLTDGSTTDIPAVVFELGDPTSV